MFHRTWTCPITLDKWVLFISSWALECSCSGFVMSQSQINPTTFSLKVNSQARMDLMHAIPTLLLACYITSWRTTPKQRLYVSMIITVLGRTRTNSVTSFLCWCLLCWRFQDISLSFTFMHGGAQTGNLAVHNRNSESLMLTTWLMLSLLFLNNMLTFQLSIAGHGTSRTSSLVSDLRPLKAFGRFIFQACESNPGNLFLAWPELPY